MSLYLDQSFDSVYPIARKYQTVNVEPRESASNLHYTIHNNTSIIVAHKKKKLLLKINPLVLKKIQQILKVAPLQETLNPERCQNNVSNLLGCRICLVEEEPTLGKLISPCKCKGSVKFIHEECLKTWILEKQGIEDALEDSIKCELCKCPLRMKITINTTYLPSMLYQTRLQNLLCFLYVLFTFISVITCAIILILELVKDSHSFYYISIVCICIILGGLFFAVMVICLKEQMEVEVIDCWEFKEFRARKIRQPQLKFKKRISTSERFINIKSTELRSLTEPDKNSKPLFEVIERKKRKHKKHQLNVLNMDSIIQFDQLPQ